MDGDSFRSRIQARIVELEALLGSAAGDSRPVELDQSRVGRLSRMDAMQDQQMVLELRRRKKRQLLEVGNAIKRIEEGNFGICIFCRKEISHERLEAFPEVQTCITCA